MNTADMLAPSASENVIGVKRQQPSVHDSEDFLPPDYSKRRRFEHQGDQSMHSSMNNHRYTQLSKSPQSAFKVPNGRNN
jgi:hypothetical protein